VLYLGGVARGEALRGGVSEVHWRLAQARHPHDAVRSWVERRAVRSARVVRFHVGSNQVRRDLERLYGVPRDLILWPRPGSIRTSSARRPIQRASVLRSTCRVTARSSCSVATTSRREGWIVRCRP